MIYLYEKLSEYLKDEEHFNEITHLEDGGSYWEVLENEIVQQLESYMEWEDKFIEKRFDSDSLDRENGREYWKKRIHQYGYHSDMLKKLMLEHLGWICGERKIYAYLSKREYIYQLSKGKSGEMREELKIIWKNGYWNFAGFQSGIFLIGEPMQ